MRRQRRCEGGDDGAALVEFIVLAVSLAVPLAYLLLAVFDVQRAAYGASSATREAARVFVLSSSTAEAERNAQAAAEVALSDHGLSLSDGEFTISCSASPCLTPGGTVRISFRTEVALPMVPTFADRGLVSMPVAASHTQTVDVYSDFRP